MPPAPDSLIIYSPPLASFLLLDSPPILASFLPLLISSFSSSTSRSFLFNSSTCCIRSSSRAIFVPVVPHVYLPRCGPSAPDLLISSSPLHLFILFTSSLLHLFILFPSSPLHSLHSLPLFTSSFSLPSSPLHLFFPLGLPHLPGAIPELCRA